MDVFVAQGDKEEKKELSDAGTALQALKDGMGDDEISSFSVDVLEDSLGASVFYEETLTRTTEDGNVSNRKVGLVNAYFVPDDEIKILVVEIDEILHNVTWKGLD
mmetsp:Transcript_10727/g.22278  ORF Transcript_10727/g.22278 Transcript_10727/m.22278 type:complete len:105 (-) Transcript_10727:48-362(-)